MGHFPTKNASGVDVKTRASGTGTNTDPYVHASRRCPSPGNTAHTATSAANAPATVTLASQGAGIFNAFRGITCSLSNVPATAVALTISDGGNIIWNVDITSSGAAFFPVAKCNNAANTTLVVSLAAGGTGIIGKVSLDEVWTFENT